MKEMTKKEKDDNQKGIFQIYGAEGGIPRDANKVNKLKVLGVQNRGKCVRSHTLYAPRFKHSKRAGIFLALLLYPVAVFEGLDFYYIIYFPMCIMFSC